MPETKIVSKIRKTAAIEESINEKKRREKEKKRKKSYLTQANKGLKTFDDLFAEIDEFWEEKEAIHFEDVKVILYPKLLLLIGTDEADKVDVSSLQNEMGFILGNTKLLDRWDTKVLSKSEAWTIYFEYAAESRNYNYRQILCIDDNGKKLGVLDRTQFVDIDNFSRSRGLYGFYVVTTMNGNNISSLRVPKGYHFNKRESTKFQIILEIGMPKELKSKGLLKNLKKLLEQGYVSIEKDNIKFTTTGIEAIESGKCTQIGALKISNESFTKNSISDNNIVIDISKMTAEQKAKALSYYADCDNIRANISPYDIAWLEDPNQGHWELWEGNEGEDLIELASGNKLYARNPQSDIKSDCIVGIDFGTKSTVVVCQNESGIIQPMPIGNGDICKELGERDFENPTVMQFINIEEFIEDYQNREGRPYTKWQDLIISHAANESMKDTGVRSTEFYSYLYDLKQWAGEGKSILNLRDKNGKDILLSPYSELSQTDSAQIDPIEIYAYYIGLYINNMNNGIYLDYLLSFPVTYEKNIRNAILDSFERGIRKSLPSSILNDDKVMKRFHVVAGSSEPAAYAICALEEYGFEPEENEKIFYGIFDFGGGTSDFDFGLWTKSEDEDLFDYCIEHFGTQGDRYLGGENILQLLAFEIFAENIQLCREKKIPFAGPIEPVNIPAKLLGFVNDSQEARMNQKLMMEKIRPFWERSDGRGENIVDITQFSEFQIGLFDRNGSLQSNLPCEVDIEKLNEILEQRIEKGVKQFFEALVDTFSNRHINKTARADKIHIFLAGNSSKSQILQKIFQENIEKWNQEIQSAKRYSDEIGHFILFPALGTEEAEKIQKERGVKREKTLAVPTGKTGVAWGLIEGREGGRIEVKEEVSFESEAKFSYYLGIQKGKNFITKIHREETYMKWIRFLPAKRKRNEILYTSLPEAVSGNLSWSEAERKIIEISVDEDSFIYIRLVSANSIEYALGDAEGNIDDTTIQKVDL